jgi:hypothetical protein
LIGKGRDESRIRALHPANFVQKFSDNREF